jgi:hypothetical protein
MVAAPMVPAEAPEAVAEMVPEASLEAVAEMVPEAALETPQEALGALGSEAPQVHDPHSHAPAPEEEAEMVTEAALEAPQEAPQEALGAEAPDAVQGTSRTGACAHSRCAHAFSHSLSPSDTSTVAAPDAAPDAAHDVDASACGSAVPAREAHSDTAAAASAAQHEAAAAAKQQLSPPQLLLPLVAPPVPPMPISLAVTTAKTDGVDATAALLSAEAALQAPTLKQYLTALFPVQTALPQSTVTNYALAGLTQQPAVGLPVPPPPPAGQLDTAKLGQYAAGALEGQGIKNPRLPQGRAGDGRSSSDGINVPSPAGSADASKTPGKPQGAAMSYTKI